MTKPYELSIEVEVGPASSLEAVSAALSDVNLVARFSILAQTQVYENTVTGLRYPYLDSEPIRAYVDSQGGAPEIRVYSVDYRNPLSLKIELNFDFLPKILEIIRDWSIDRSRGHTEVDYLRRHYEAKADAERALADYIVGALERAGTPLSPQDLRNLTGARGLLAAMGRLGASEVRATRDEPSVS